MPLGSPIPGPPASVLATVLAASPSHPYDPSQARRATFSGSNYPDLPSLTNDVVALPLYAYLDANVEVGGTLTSNGWATGAVTSVTAAYTIGPADAVILADATSGPFTVTLPDATQQGFAAGQRYTVIKTDSSGNSVTVAGSAGQKIAGQTSVILTSGNGYTSVVFDGANWQIWSGYTVIGPTFAAEVSATDFKATGMAGATAGMRVVGATTTGAPVSGTFSVDDMITTKDGNIWICTTAGSPGTWLNAANQYLPLAGGTLTGTLNIGNFAAIECSGDLNTGFGQVRVQSAGNGFRVAEGGNAKQGAVTLTAGQAVVANTSVTSTSRIFLTGQADGGTPGWLRVSARTAGTSFTIRSSSGTDTSTVAYEIFEVN